MNGSTFGTISAVVNILLLLGWLAFVYNKWIEKLGPRGEGWAWLQVVVGVGFTLIGVFFLDLLLDWNAAFISLMAFSASGLPMMAGAYQRHREAQERAKKALQE